MFMDAAKFALVVGALGHEAVWKFVNEVDGRLSSDVCDPSVDDGDDDRAVVVLAVSDNKVYGILCLSMCPSEDRGYPYRLTSVGYSLDESDGWDRFIEWADVG
jgi:hypothetical protein